MASLFPGGRDGSYLHASTELLYQPSHYTLAGGRELELDRWSWAHQGMLNTRVWMEVVAASMKSLPLPLAGHCLGDIRDRSSEGGCTLLFFYSFLSVCLKIRYICIASLQSSFIVLFPVSFELAFSVRDIFWFWEGVLIKLTITDPKIIG